jgi:hypothetical protein
MSIFKIDELLRLKNKFYKSIESFFVGQGPEFKEREGEGFCTGKQKNRRRQSEKCVTGERDFAQGCAVGGRERQAEQQPTA